MLEVTLDLEHLLFVKRIYVAKISKANVASWMLLCATISLYGIARWIQAPFLIAEEYRPRPTTADYLICLTNNSGVMSMTKGSNSVFPAKIPPNRYAFIANSQAAAKLIQIKNTDAFVPCDTYFNKFIYSCCQYSPNSAKHVNINTYIGQYNYNFEIDEGSFQIENIIFGRSRRIIQRVAISTEAIQIRSEHKCSADVAVDPYPELHIDVQLNDENGTSSHQFHWYL